MNARPGRPRAPVRRPATRPRGARLESALGAFALGSVAQGTPFVVVAVALERRGVSSAWLAALAIGRLAPYVVCSPIAGVVVGRCAPERVLRVTLVARAVVLVGLVIALCATAPPTVLLAGTFLLVAAGTPAYPALMRIVHERSSERCGDRTAALAGGIESASFWIGPALGGLLVGLSPALLLVPVGALALGATLVGPAGMDGSVAPPDAPPAVEVRRRPASGAQPSDRPADGHAGVLPAVVAVVVTNVLAGMLGVLLVRLPADLGLGGARTYGTLVFAQGIGALVAALVVLARPALARSATTWVLAAGLVLAVLGSAAALAVAVLACACFGAAVLVSEVGASVSLNRALHRSRVAAGFGLLDSGMVLAMAVGAAVTPFLESALGSTGALVGVGLAVASTAALIGFGRRRATATERSPLPPQPPVASRLVTVTRPAGGMADEVGQQVTPYSGRSPVARAVDPVSL